MKMNNKNLLLLLIIVFMLIQLPVFSSICRPICGNHILETGEECEPPNTPICTNKCMNTIPTCIIPTVDVTGVVNTVGVNTAGTSSTESSETLSTDANSSVSVKKGKSNQIVQIIIPANSLPQKNILLRKSNKNQSSKPEIPEVIFENISLKVIKTEIKKENSKLIVTVRLPKNYKGGTEELTISTLDGQTSIEINLPKVRK